MKLKLFIFLIFVGVVGTWVACMHSNENGAEALPETVSFNFHIRPILSDKCFKCHGPDVSKMEAHLRLDKPAFAFAALQETKGAYAIVPGKPEESELYKRISSTDSSYMMPLPEAHLGALTPYEIKLFKKWIKQGAHYEPHWAFQKPKKTPLPKVKKEDWAKNEIDYFVLSKLERKGLVPNDEEAKERLYKRLSLDLTGLPPAPEA